MKSILKEQIKKWSVSNTSETKTDDKSYLVAYNKYKNDFQSTIVGEPLLEEEQRFNLFPVEYMDFYDEFKTQSELFWVSKEIDLSKDRADWDKLQNEEKYFLSMILAFFAGSDGFVNFNLFENFHNEVKVIEAQMVYSVQLAIESIHSETYSKLIDVLITDMEEKELLFNAIKKIPTIRKKAEWAQKWISSDHPFSHRLIAFAIVEGIFFSGSFCALIWQGEKGILPGLVHANEFIRRDEGRHVAFACMLYSHLKNKLKEEIIVEIIKDAVEIEKDFFTDALPIAMLRMNIDKMTQYIEYVADQLIVELGYKKIYKSENPFLWMDKSGQGGNKDFFNKRDNNYKRGGNEDIKYKDDGKLYMNLDD